MSRPEPVDPYVVDDTSRRTKVLFSALAGSAILMAVVAFAGFTSASRVADRAHELHWANATLGTAAQAWAAARQVAVFTEVPDAEAASLDAGAIAREELETTSAALSGLAATAPAEFEDELDAMVGLLTADRVEMGTIDDRYRSVAGRLRDRIDAIEASIENSERLAGYASVGIRLLVSLIIPASAVLLYRRHAAKHVRASEARFAAELAAEQEISRSKDRFVNGMSHEIRTALMGIYGDSAGLLDSPPGASFDREVVGSIHSAAADLTQMVDDLIITSRIDGGFLEMELGRVDLRSVAETVAERFQRRGYRIHIVGDSTHAMCDMGRTFQVLTNLVANACRHGGPNIAIVLDGDGTLAHCRVIDDGDGVDDRIEGLLFSRIEQDGTEGLMTNSPGLGTWVARELVCAMGGDITYERKGSLTVFHISLPYVKVDAPATAGQPSVQAGR